MIFKDWLAKHGYTIALFSDDSRIGRRKLCQWFNTGIRPTISEDIYAFADIVHEIDPEVNWLDFFRHVAQKKEDAEKTGTIKMGSLFD